MLHGAVKRIRPKFMTVATMFMGLVPIMWSAGTDGTQTLVTRQGTYLRHRGQRRQQRSVAILKKATATAPTGL
jgi:hypothetical protein